jgi:anti-sigma regulatory factor (Ser/Thr protein kinase)
MEQLTVKAVLDNLEQMLDFVTGVAGKAGATKQLQNTLRLVCEEALVNVINYAYPGSEGELTITAEIKPTPPAIVLEIIDGGIAFNPLDRPTPDISLPAEQRPIGGLGIFIIKKNMDCVDYKHDNGRNVLTMEKRLPLRG